MATTDLDVLARSPLLAALDRDAVTKLFEPLDVASFAAGKCIFREGDTGDFIYFVLEGEARLRRGALELRRAGPGDHFGELSFISAKKRAASVEAFSDVRLAKVSPARYAAWAKTRPVEAASFTRALAISIGELLIALTDSMGLLAYQRTIPRRVELKVHRGASEVIVGTGTLAGSLLPREEDGQLVVGATIDRKPASLETPIVSDADIGALRLDDLEGRSIFRRSAGLVLLEAARRAHPELIVRLGPPLENGQVIDVDATDRAALAASLTAAMNELVHDDVPLREEIWQIEEALSQLRENGWDDAASLLPSRRDPVVTLVTCGETFAIGMGPVVPSASFVEGISLEPHPAGLLMRLGEAVDHTMPKVRGVFLDPIAKEIEFPRYGGEMTASVEKWLSGLGVTSVGRFNERCVSGKVDELIRVAEGSHEKWIGRIADAIANRKEPVKVITIAGPSSSGKTTFIKRLTVQLRVDGLAPVEISLDDYYVDREKTVKDEHGEYDFEAFEAIDAALLQTQTRRLLAGELVKTARYDFVAGKSFASGGKEVTLAPDGVLVLEGIHGLNPALLEGVPPECVFRIFVHPATTLPFDRLSVLAPEDVRLVRRIVRDRHQRNYAAAETILRWPSVRKGEIIHIMPYLPNADIAFDSSLVYEMSVLKTYAERYLLEVPASHPAFSTAYRLRNLIDQFVAIYPDHVPPTSVIREFIGGSGFEY